jgi:anti-anti-sigma factor
VPVRFDHSEAPATVHLEGTVDIGCAADLKQALLDALAGGAVRVALRDATEIDVTALQLLLAAERACAAAGTKLTLSGPVPEAIRAIARDAGLARFPAGGEPGEEVES